MTTILRVGRRAVALLTTAALLAPPPAFAAEAAKSVLEGVEAGTDKVSIHLSKPAQFNAFTTAEPPRLVVELLGTELEGPSQIVKGKGKFLDKVRAGQYQKDPPIARVVLYLKSLVSYKARWEGPRLDVELVGPVSDADVQAPEPAPAPVVKAEPKPAPAPAPKPEPKPEPKPAPKPVPVPVPAVAVKPVAPARAPAPAPAPVAAPKPAAAPAPAPVAKPANALPVEKPLAAVEETLLPKNMSSEPSVELSRMAGITAPKAVASALGEKGRLRRDILATLPSDPVTLEFDNMDVHDVLALLAQKANVNMVYGADVTGSITLQLRDVPFNEAFLTVLSMKGLVANQVGENILRILPPAALRTERSNAVTQTRVMRLKYAKAEEISTSIVAVMSAENRSAKITVDKNTNALIVTDTLEGFAAIERLLSELDIRPQQVLIEAKLVEVQLTKDLALGIQWDYLSNFRGKIDGVDGRNLVGSITNPAASAAVTKLPLDTNADSKVSDVTKRGTGVFLPADKVFGAFTFGRVTSNYFLSATLTAAASQGKAKVLSDPKVTALNGKKATINITTRIPYVTSDTTPSGGTVTTTQKVDYQETGITLEVTPTINADGRITLDVKPSVKQPSAIAASAGTTGAISVDSREANTIVIVQDGGTVVIGGLITDSSTENVAKIPLLGDIPILGYLFRKKFIDRKRVELLIFVTTKIMPS